MQNQHPPGQDQRERQGNQISSKLANFSLSIRHGKAKDNVVADAMTRLHTNHESNTDSVIVLKSGVKKLIVVKQSHLELEKML